MNNMGNGSSHPHKFKKSQSPAPPADAGRKSSAAAPQIAKFGKDVAKAVQGKDVMISYSHQDLDIMRKLKGFLEAEGISVWVDETGLSPGTSYLREIGEAIVDSSTFLVILSPHSVTSKYCQDEVSLSYISNKNIFAVAVKPFDELAPVMDLGMKLTVSPVQWHFVDEANIKKQVEPLISRMKGILSAIKQQTQDSDHEGGISEEDDGEQSNYVMNTQAFKLRRLMSGTRLNSFDESSETERVVDTKDGNFWGSNFGKETQNIEWTKFSQTVNEAYDDVWKQMMVTEQQKQLLLHLMSKEMRVLRGVLQFKEFKKFCTRDREHLPLSQAIRLYAAETYAMKEVFNVNSSVRLSAIANLRKYQSKAVIDSLLDLLENEEDPDVTVVAAISLAYAASGIKMFKRRAEEGLILCLNSDDRLVRESGCLALGRLKSKKSVTKLVQIWRNDTISSVREAAQIAVNQIGGEEAEQAMHVTKVLSEEIGLLKQ